MDLDRFSQPMSWEGKRTKSCFNCFYYDKGAEWCDKLDVEQYLYDAEESSCEEWREKDD